jgi:Helix-turn-helix domain
VEHRQVQARYTTACRASGDDPARFLKELRQLRDGAGLGPAELAARAHYPYDRIRAAEAGPALPDLPVLSAYVRGCGGTTEEWEERWRSLTSAPTLPLLAARPAGSSTAADAGARIGSISPAADTPDPSIILAALDRVAEGMAVADPAPLPSRSGLSTIEDPPGDEPTVWETSTTETAWGTAAASTVRESDQTAAEAGSATGEAEVTEAKAAAPTTAATPTAADPAPASTASARPTVTDVRASASRMGQALSRTTILTAILVLICVLVAVLTIFA